jgi:hypothetical protein
MWRIVLAFSVCAFSYPLIALLSDYDYYVSAPGDVIGHAKFTVTLSLILGALTLFHFPLRGRWEFWRYLLAGLAIGAVTGLPLLFGWDIPLLFCASSFMVVYYFSLRRHWQPWRYLFAALAIGLAVSLPSVIDWYWVKPVAFFGSVYAVLGAAHALLFWVIALWRNQGQTGNLHSHPLNDKCSSQTAP